MYYQWKWKKFSECYLNGVRDTFRVSKYKWQNIKKTTLSDWYLWDNNNRKLFCTTNIGRYLKKPLGLWIHDISQECSWYKHPHLNILYHRADNIVHTYTPSKSKRSSKRQGLQWNMVRKYYITQMYPIMPKNLLLPIHLGNMNLSNSGGCYFY